MIDLTILRSDSKGRPITFNTSNLEGERPKYSRKWHCYYDRCYPECRPCRKLRETSQTKEGRYPLGHHIIRGPVSDREFEDIIEIAVSVIMKTYGLDRQAALDIVYSILARILYKDSIEVKAECLKRYIIASARYEAVRVLRNDRGYHFDHNNPHPKELIEFETPETRLENQEMYEIIKAGIQKLPERQAKAVELKYLDNYRYKEIGQLLNTTPNAAKALVTRGIASLGEIKSLKNLYNGLFENSVKKATYVSYKR